MRRIAFLDTDACWLYFNATRSSYRMHSSLGLSRWSIFGLSKISFSIRDMSASHMTGIE